MDVVIAILGILQMLAGILVALTAKSAIHEILGAVSFGLGTLAIGVATIIARLSAVKASSEKQADFFQSLSDSRKKSD